MANLFKKKEGQTKPVDYNDYIKPKDRIRLLFAKLNKYLTDESDTTWDNYIKWKDSILDKIDGEQTEYSEKLQVLLEKYWGMADLPKNKEYKTGNINAQQMSKIQEVCMELTSVPKTERITITDTKALIEKYVQQVETKIDTRLNTIETNTFNSFKWFKHLDEAIQELQKGMTEIKGIKDLILKEYELIIARIEFPSHLLKTLMCLSDFVQTKDRSLLEKADKEFESSCEGNGYELMLDLFEKWGIEENLFTAPNSSTDSTPIISIYKISELLLYEESVKKDRLATNLKYKIKDILNEHPHLRIELQLEKIYNLLNKDSEKTIQPVMAETKAPFKESIPNPIITTEKEIDKELDQIIHPPTLQLPEIQKLEEKAPQQIEVKYTSLAHVNSVRKGKSCIAMVNSFLGKWLYYSAMQNRDDFDSANGTWGQVIKKFQESNHEEQEEVRKLLIAIDFPLEKDGSIPRSILHLKLFLEQKVNKPDCEKIRLYLKNNAENISPGQPVDTH